MIYAIAIDELLNLFHKIVFNLIQLRQNLRKEYLKNAGISTILIILQPFLHTINFNNSYIQHLCWEFLRILLFRSGLQFFLRVSSLSILSYNLSIHVIDKEYNSPYSKMLAYKYETMLSYD